MRLVTRRLVLVLALMLAAGPLASCAKPYPDLQTFSAVEAKLPPPAHGQSRIYFYRLLSYYDVPDGTSVYLNQQNVGYSRIGTVFYRDVAPGSYFVSVLSRGAYPDQFKTIKVKPGQVWYIRVESLLSWSYSVGGGGIAARGDTFTVNVIAPEAAKQEIQGLSYLPPG